jgi:DNA-binding CsgD family transcriptional regulator
METITIPHLSPQEFNEKIRVNAINDSQRYLDYFESTILNISNFAIGPYFWFIPDNSSMVFLKVSENCREQSPYTEAEWLNPEDSLTRWTNTIHPEDREFVLSAAQFSMEIAAQFHSLNKEIKTNIYGRFLNAKHEYCWKLMQVLGYYFDESGICPSVLLCFTDISHLSPQKSPIMTVLSSEGINKQLFQVIPATRQLISMPTAHLSKREKQIIKLMACGFSTPQIADELSIAYSTVQNHKKNIREKTNTKTAAELINYVITNQLI